MEGSSREPGPDPERLTIEGDPEEALGRLLGKRERQHSGPVVLLHDRWGGDEDFESHKLVSSYDTRRRPGSGRAGVAGPRVRPRAGRRAPDLPSRWQRGREFRAGRVPGPLGVGTTPPVPGHLARFQQVPTPASLWPRPVLSR